MRLNWMASFFIMLLSLIGGLSPALALGDPSLQRDGYERFFIGDRSLKRLSKPEAGLLLSGGGDWAVEAFRWFAKKAGHGHLVVLRASGATETANEFYNKIKGLASVETFVFHDRSAAYDVRIIRAINNADGLFIAGGDQARYIRFWRDTPLSQAIEDHIKANKPLGGTSAGLAIMGEYSYGAMDGGSITSDEALNNPMGPKVTIERRLYSLSSMDGIVTDSHFSERGRQGRLAAFLIKAQTLKGAPLTGLGIDEETALIVEPDGRANVTSNKDGLVWMMKQGPDANGFGVVGIGSESRFHLLSKKVNSPRFVRQYSLKHSDEKKVEFMQEKKWSLAIHGGAGVLEPTDMTPELEADYRQGLKDALAKGEAILAKGGSALDAVEATVVSLENNPLFNAGKGAVFTAEGKNELDAAIMEGTSLKAGAVAGVTRTKNPIKLARAVMEKSGRLLLAREGADAFSKENGLEQVEPDYYFTQKRFDQLQKWKKRQLALLDQSHRFGTVGAVALDQDGHLAAATSTGGLTGKVFGRIGDTPIIGAGTFADSRYCAVSATGTGEYFIRESAGRQICDRMRWHNQTIHEAAYDTIMSVGAIGGDGGLIAMDKNGDVAFALNDLGMYRGWVASWRKPETAIYGDDQLKVSGRNEKTSDELH